MRLEFSNPEAVNMLQNTIADAVPVLRVLDISEGTVTLELVVMCKDVELMRGTNVITAQAGDHISLSHVNINLQVEGC